MNLIPLIFFWLSIGDEGKSGSHSLEKRRRTKFKWAEMESGRSGLESARSGSRARDLESAQSRERGLDSRLELFSDVIVVRGEMWRER